MILNNMLQFARPHVVDLVVAASVVRVDGEQGVVVAHEVVVVDVPLERDHRSVA